MNSAIRLCLDFVKPIQESNSWLINMVRIWKEKRKRMSGWKSSNRRLSPQVIDCPMAEAIPAAFSPDPAIIPEWIYYVYVCGFTFRFWSVEQIQVCLDFYARKNHPSSRIKNVDATLYHISHRNELQRWYEQLPLYLRKEGKRQKVVKALEKALQDFKDDPPLHTPVSGSTKYIPRYHIYWCSKCKKRLGEGRCLKCKRQRSETNYRVANCNTCNKPLGEGSCTSCEKFRQTLESV